MQRTKWHCLCRNAVCTVLQKVTSRLRWHQCNCTIKWRPNRWRPCSRSPTLVGSVTRQTRKRVSAKCFFQLRQLRRIRRSLDDDSVATLVHAFVASRVDYCGSLLIGAPRKTTDKLQRVLKSAVRIVSNTRKFDRGLSHSRRSQLHWLMLSTGFGSEFASRCSDVCTRWLLNTCLPTANLSLAVATCDRLSVPGTAAIRRRRR